MEKDERNDNKQSKIVIILVSIIIILVFIIGILLGTKINYKQTTNNNIVNKKSEKQRKHKKEEIKDNKKEDEIPEFDSGIPMGYCSGILFPFEEKDIYLKDLDDKTKINMLIAFLSSKEYKPIDEGFDNDSFKRITEVTKEDAKKYFANVDFFDKIGKVEGTGASFYQIIKRNNKYYLALELGGCEGPGKGGEDIALTKTKRDNQYVIKTYKYYYIEYNLDKDPLSENGSEYYYFNLYKDKNHKELLAKNLYNIEEIKSYYDKMNTYDIYYDISNGNIRFEKMIFNAK